MDLLVRTTASARQWGERHTDLPQALLIAGPTASGKSALALRLAERIGGIVVNADSMQVYADLAILTARPGQADLARAPHALYGMVDAAESYSVTRWLADIARTIVGSEALPIVVGGTGLYFRALTAGLSPIPPVPEAVREEVRVWAEGRPSAEMHARLSAIDPLTAARLRPTDPQRIVRALEVHAATGRSLAEYQSRRQEPLLALERCRAVTLTVERHALRDRLDRRFDDMMDAGAIAEVERLAWRHLPRTLPAMRALGVPPLLRAVRGEEALDDAIAAAKTETKRYAKRQETFFRHQLVAFAPMGVADAEHVLLRAADRPQR